MNVFPPEGLTQITHRWPPRIVTSIPHIGNVSKFELLLNNDTPFFFDAATLMKSQMEKIGVEVKLTMTDKPPSIDRSASLFFRGAKSSDGGLESPEIEELSIKWWREVSAEARKQITYDIQRAFAKDMLRCNITGSPYFQTYQKYVKGYHFMNQLYVRWETTWLDKA